MIAERAEKIDHGITLWSKRAGLVLLGWLLSSAWYGTGSFEKAQKAIPALQAEAGCEHWRASKTAKLALGNTMVVPSQIPKDCAHVPSADIPEAN